MKADILPYALAAVFAGMTAASFAQTTETPPKRMVDVVAPTFVAPAKNDSKIICKRDYQIGSWVKNVRRCGTKQEWIRSEEAARRETMAIQDQKGRYTAP